MAYVQSYTLSNSAPIHDPGYFDVPICNQFSNQPPARDPTQSISAYDLNQAINLTINDNKDSYTVYQQPTRPSPSLMTESNDSMTGYYGPHTKPYNQLRKKKELQTVVYDTEHFTGRGAQDDYSYLVNPPMAVDNRLMGPTSTYQQTMSGQQPVQDFLNFQSIPNIAGLQWQQPQQQQQISNPYSSANSYKVCPCCTRPYNMQQNVPPCATCPFARKGAMCPMMMKQMNMRRRMEREDSDDDSDDGSDSDEDEEPPKKKQEKQEKVSKKYKKAQLKDNKKKATAASSLFFIALIVILIAIFFFLYKFSVEKKIKF